MLGATISNKVSQGLAPYHCDECGEFFWMSKAKGDVAKQKLCRVCWPQKFPYTPPYPFASRLTEYERDEMEAYSPHVKVSYTSPAVPQPPLAPISTPTSMSGNHHKKIAGTDYSERGKKERLQKRMLFGKILKRHIIHNSRTDSAECFARACGVATATILSYASGEKTTKVFADTQQKIGDEIHRRGWDKPEDVQRPAIKQEGAPVPAPFVPSPAASASPNLTIDEKIQVIKNLDPEIVKKLFPTL